jgi:hypothetical protein
LFAGLLEGALFAAACVLTLFPIFDNQVHC